MTAERDGLVETCAYPRCMDGEGCTAACIATNLETNVVISALMAGRIDGPEAVAAINARLADLLAARDRRVRGEALRDLATETRRMPADPDKAADWLRDRADRIEAP